MSLRVCIDFKDVMADNSLLTWMSLNIIVETRIVNQIVFMEKCVHVQFIIR